MRASEARVAPEGLRVVLVDSREERRRLMVDVVEGEGDRAFVVAEADSPESARVAVGKERADVVVVDVRMPTAVGLRTIQHLREECPGLGIVVCSFDLDAATTREALLFGADACVPKPASPFELVGALVGARPRRDVIGGGTRVLASTLP